MNYIVLSRFYVVQCPIKDDGILGCTEDLLKLEASTLNPIGTYIANYLHANSGLRKEIQIDRYLMEIYGTGQISSDDTARGFPGRLHADNQIIGAGKLSLDNKNDWAAIEFPYRQALIDEIILASGIEPGYLKLIDYQSKL